MVLVVVVGNISNDGIYFLVSYFDVIVVGVLGCEDCFVCYSVCFGVVSGLW